MANANVAQDSARVGSTPDDLDAIFQDLMECGPLISPESHDALRELAESANMTVRPWLFTAWIAIQNGNFFQGLSDDAHSARLMAPMSKLLEEFSERLQMVTDLAAKSALRIRLAGCSHEDFDAWREEDPNANTAGGAAHV